MLQIMWELAHQQRIWHNLSLAAVRERVGWRKQQPAFSTSLPELFTVRACLDEPACNSWPACHASSRRAQADGPGWRHALQCLQQDVK